LGALRTTAGFVMAYGLEAALGLNESVAKNVPQQSLRRLQDADLVLRMDYGDYRVQDDTLAEWLRNQEIVD
jgi:hypothetical protein